MLVEFLKIIICVKSYFLTSVTFNKYNKSKVRIKFYIKFFIASGRLVKYLFICFSLKKKIKNNHISSSLLSSDHES